jgi:LuxR family maltose regulon positive regulatory protein
MSKTADAQLPNMLDSFTPGLVLKLIPPRLRSNSLPRERLRHLRDAAGDVAVILLQAPAGFGKTTLLAQWRLDRLQAGCQVSWLELDSSDSVSSIASGLIEGLRRATGTATFGHDALESFRRGGDLIQAVTTLVAELAENAHPTVVIVDNCDRITDPAVIELANYLLHNLPPNLQVVLGSRKTIALQTGELLAHGQLMELGAKELRFDLEETLSLLTQKLGDKASVELAARLQDLTEGWPLGLQMVTDALERSSDPEQTLQEFSISSDEPSQRLLGGFLQLLPSDLGDFILRCSLLDALHPDLCTALTGRSDAAEALIKLRNETPLLVTAERSDWLRLNPLVREYLREKAASSMPQAELQEAHRRAWQWLAAHGEAEQAARHALAAGQRSEAFALIAASLYDCCMKQGLFGTVAEWLKRLPEEEVFRHPALRLTAGWQNAMSGKWRQAEYFLGAMVSPPCEDRALYAEALAILATANSRAERLDVAQRYLDAFPKDTPDGLATRIITHLQAFFALFHGKTEEARNLLMSIPSDNHFFTQEAFRARTLAHIYLWEGRPVQAESAARRQHARCERIAGRRNEMTMALASVLANACWERDARDEARALLAFRLDLERGTDSLLPSERSYLTLAAISASDGNEARAFALLEALGGLGSKQDVLSIRLLSKLERIRLHASRQRSSQCQLLLDKMKRLFDEEVEKTADELHPLLHLYHDMAHAYSLMAGEQQQDAGEWLEAALQQAHKLNRGREIVQILSMQAVLLDIAGQPADDLLNSALGHAEAGGQVRVFVETLPAVIDLIRRYANQAGERLKASQAFIQQILNAAGQHPDEAPQSSAAPFTTAATAFLTPKESEVLQLLAGGLPNKRIASTMGLSSETIKWHMKKLFIKLNAGSRQHAVDRARLLGLLP